MSVLERIRQLREQREGEEAEKRRREEQSQKEASDDTARSAAMAAEKRDRIINDSGLLEILQEIDDNLLGKASSHGIIRKSNGVGLVWGEGIEAKDGEMHLSNQYSYSSVAFEIDPDQETIFINSAPPKESSTGMYGRTPERKAPNLRTLRRKDWERRDLLETLIAQAFLNPLSESFDAEKHFSFRD